MKSCLVRFYWLVRWPAAFGLLLNAAWAAQVDLPQKLPGTINASAPAASTVELPRLIEQFSADFGDVKGFYNLPWSTQRWERIQVLLDSWKERLAAVPFETLEPSARVDYLLLRNKLTAEKARLTLERQRLKEMEELLPFRVAVQELQQTRWRMEPIDPQQAAAAVSGIPAELKKLRKRIAKSGATADEKDKDKEKEKDKEKDKDKEKEKSTEQERAAAGPKLRIAPALAQRASSAADDLRRALKDWAAFYDGFVPEFAWWVKKPNAEAQSALESYSKFLREEIAGLKGEDEDPLVGDPIGAEALATELAEEMLAYTPEELIAIGEREFAWCEARMKEAAAEMGLGSDWRAALAKVKSDFVPPGQQDRVIADKARGAIAFVKNLDLVTIPPLAEEAWRLSMLSPEAQRNLPYAAYSGPNMLVAYARDDMKHDDKLMSMRGNNPHFMHIVTPHELIPGHHLQRFMSARNHLYRRSFGTPFYVEGWALYWEFTLWDRNYGRTPEDRIGMLFWRMHRAARIIVSLKFHLGQMTPAQMVDFIADRVGHERLGATSEVRRFIGSDYSPLYQCGYMIGGLQLRALRTEALKTGRYTEKQFNDAVLTQGPIPIEFIRTALLELPVTRESKPNWRFAD